MNKYNTIILICLLSLLGACQKKSESKTFLLHVEAYDMESKEPLTTKIAYHISTGKVSLWGYKEKGINLEVKTVGKTQMDISVTSDGYEKKSFKIPIGETTKEIYLKKK